MSFLRVIEEKLVIRSPGSCSTRPRRIWMRNAKKKKKKKKQNPLRLRHKEKNEAVD